MSAITPKQILTAYRALVAGASLEKQFRALVVGQMTAVEQQVYDYVRRTPYKTSLQISEAVRMNRVHAAMILLRLTRQGVLIREIHVSTRKRDQYVYYDGFTADAPSAGD